MTFTGITLLALYPQNETFESEIAIFSCARSLIAEEGYLLLLQMSTSEKERMMMISNGEKCSAEGVT